MTKRRKHSSRKPARPSSGRSSSQRQGRRGAKVPHPTEALDLSGKVPPGERDTIVAARKDTERSIQHWLQEAASLSQKKKSKDEHRPLMDRLDPWQREAVEALLQGEHVVVDAPTTAGKTRVVEAFFELHIDEPGFRAAYTTPVKSLSNDKLREFSAQFGRDQVGIATGDVKENLRAPIVVATLESYRNSLLGVEPDLGRSLVVFDEYHFMQDVGRGSAWEEAIILTPPSCQLLLLSASVDNPEAFCAWIQKITGRACRLIQTKERPVPLVELVYYREQWLLVDAVRDILPPKPAVSPRFPLEQSEIARRLRSIPAMGLSPCLIYAGRRMACENMARELCQHLEPIPREQAQTIREALESDPETPELMKFLKADLRRMLLMYGVGYHHSGLAPVARRVIEKLVKNGLLRFCVATMGLSIGINFSVRSALISDYTRPGEMGFTAYPPSEVLQMLGRAGRRGKDLVGFSLWPSVASLQKFGGARREACESRLKNDPTTFLGLVGRGFRLRDLENFYEKSFLRFGDRSVHFGLIRDTVISKQLGSESLPCLSSPAHAMAQFQQDPAQGPCGPCAQRTACHSFIGKRLQNSLAALHLHLHTLGCLDAEEQLTDMGSIARYFPQSGGLHVARLVADGHIQLDTLLTGAELMGALCLSRFKSPRLDRSYRFPFDAAQLEKDLQKAYPVELFEELYDPPTPRRETYLFREFNPLGGSVVRQWLLGTSWSELVKQFSDEKFGQGDLMALLYRTATYLQSLSQVHIPQLSRAAAALRNELLRDPLGAVLRGESEEPSDITPNEPSPQGGAEDASSTEETPDDTSS